MAAAETAAERGRYPSRRLRKLSRGTSSCDTSKERSVCESLYELPHNQNEER